MARIARWPLPTWAHASQAASACIVALAYALGVAGTLWDWHDHMIGPGTQPPHLLIDLGGLVVLGVLAFSGKMELRSRSYPLDCYPVRGELLYRCRPPSYSRTHRESQLDGRNANLQTAEVMSLRGFESSPSTHLSL